MRVFISQWARLVSLLLLVVSSSWAGELEQYINEPDTAFSVQPRGVLPGVGYQVHLLELASQEWPSTGPDRRVWRHGVAVIVPSQVIGSTAMLFVGSGSNATPLSAKPSEIALGAQIAIASRSIVAVVGQVPNQPLSLGGTEGLAEDALVALSWDRAMDTGDYRQVVYLPMAKSVVKAMDAVQNYVLQAQVGSIADFVLTGFSKRAAATWLTAAVDPRVRAIAPGVFDFLNMDDQVEHHFGTYGFFAPAVSDYTQNGVLTRLRIPEGRELLRIVDPISYSAALRMPKYLINSPGDQFFVPDSSQKYIGHLQGETRIRYVPNTDHSLSTTTAGPQDALTGLLGWYHTILTDSPRAEVTWKHTSASSIAVSATQLPIAATLWEAHNPHERDFRKEMIGESWSGTPVMPQADGTFSVALPSTSVGWSARFLELKFLGPAGVPQIYSTPVFVTPRALPFELVEAITETRGAKSWLHALKDSRSPDFAAVQAKLPFRVLHKYVRDMSEVVAMLSSRLPNDQAEKHCLATRLNIESGRMGWYSPTLELGVGDWTGKVWQEWNLANALHDFNLPWLAAAVCDNLNDN